MALLYGSWVMIDIKTIQFHLYILSYIIIDFIRMGFVYAIKLRKLGCLHTSYMSTTPTTLPPILRVQYQPIIGLTGPFTYWIHRMCYVFWMSWLDFCFRMIFKVWLNQIFSNFNTMLWIIKYRLSSITVYFTFTVPESWPFLS
jgi:hypothetical protein